MPLAIVRAPFPWQPATCVVPAWVFSPDRIRPIKRRCPRSLFARVQACVGGSLGGFQIVEDALPRVLTDRSHPVPLLHLCDQLRPAFPSEMVRGDDRGRVARQAMREHEFAAWSRLQPGLRFKRIRWWSLRRLRPGGPPCRPPQDDHRASHPQEGPVAGMARFQSPQTTFTAIRCIALLQ